MGNREVELLHKKHEFEMEKLEYERETQLKVLEKQFEIKMREKGFATSLPTPQMPQMVNPNYFPTNPQFVEHNSINDTDVEKSTKKYNKK